MKILYIGEVGGGQTALMRMRALERLGHTVRGVNTEEPWQRSSWFGRQLQRRLQCGPIVDRINSNVVSSAREFLPNLVWADKQRYLASATIEELQRLGARLIHFTPDPYFYLSWKRTRLMNQAIRSFDVLVYCKSYERRDYEALDKPAIYMPLGFCDEMHRPLPTVGKRWNSTVGFIGGWEPRRERMLHAAVAAGADVKIWGRYWNFLRDGKWTPRRHIILHQLAGGAKERVRFHRDVALGAAWQGEEVYDDDYARALTGAKIGLGFVRVVCPDQHTTRTFEIPACGSMLLADRTDEHREFFEEGKEADFFSSETEFLDKIKFYGSNERARAKIAEAGYRRCFASRYAYVHRLATVLDQIAAT